MRLVCEIVTTSAHLRQIGKKLLSARQQDRWVIDATELECTIIDTKKIRELVPTVGRRARGQNPYDFSAVGDDGLYLPGDRVRSLGNNDESAIYVRVYRAD